MSANLFNVNTNVKIFVTGSGALNETQEHSSIAGIAMAGYDPDGQQTGMAYGSELWSGAVSVSHSESHGFMITDASVASTYVPIMLTGIDGRTADVFNSSWGCPAWKCKQIVDGVDGILYRTGKTGVVAVGNDGPGSNTVYGIANGYNVIAVAALGPANSGDDGMSSTFDQSAPFSGSGPIDYTDPRTQKEEKNARARVDIAVPPVYEACTSFASPVVAAGAALIIDAGKDIYAGNPHAIDGRVVKAVLLNGADKTAGWDNGQHYIDGVLLTTQSMDYRVGTGRMNLVKTYFQYANPGNGGNAATSDVQGIGCETPSVVCGIPNIAPTGWDFGKSEKNGANLYFMGERLKVGSTVTVTLDWYANIDPGSDKDFMGAAQKKFVNLDLLFFTYDMKTQALLKTISISSSVYNTVEHLSFVLPESGWYGIGVINSGDLWDKASTSGEYYGLAWNVANGRRSAKTKPTETFSWNTHKLRRISDNATY